MQMYTSFVLSASTYPNFFLTISIKLCTYQYIIYWERRDEIGRREGGGRGKRGERKTEKEREREGGV